jgi:hypothetical protein
MSPVLAHCGHQGTVTGIAVAFLIAFVLLKLAELL